MIDQWANLHSPVSVFKLGRVCKAREKSNSCFESGFWIMSGSVSHQKLQCRKHSSVFMFTAVLRVLFHKAKAYLACVCVFAFCENEVHAPLCVFFLFCFVWDVTGKGSGWTTHAGRSLRRFATSHLCLGAVLKMRSGVFRLHKSAVIIIIMSCFKSPPPENASSTAAPIKKS